MVNSVFDSSSLQSVSGAFRAFVAPITILCKQIIRYMSEGLIYHLALLILLEVTASGFCASFVSHLSSIDFVSIGDGSVLVAIT